MLNNSKIAWHTRSIKGIEKALNTNISKGLSMGQIQFLQKEFGENTLKRVNRYNILRVIIRQFSSPLVLILLVSFIVTIFLASYADAMVMFLAILTSVGIGILQEDKSTRVLENISKTAYSTVIVLRDGVKIEISSIGLVPGDVVYLSGGDKVPADIRLVSSSGLQVNESPITGELKPVKKSLGILKDVDLPVSEQSNMVFMGTSIVEGFCVGVVVATGSETLLGDLALITKSVESKDTALSKSITALAYNIVIAIGIIIAIIFTLGILRGGSVADMLLLAVAVAVAAMPEGLPAAVTVVLAVAMESVMRKGGLVKNLMATETLGSTTVIVTDKTGTLTKGAMELEQVHIANSGVIKSIPIKDVEGDALSVVKFAVLASDAFISIDEDGKNIVHGRPIEQAIIKGAMLSGLQQDELFAQGNNRLEFVQFESKRRYAISLNVFSNKSRVYITGSPEHILEHSTHYLHNGERKPLTSDIREDYTKLQKELSLKGKGFTAIGYRDSVECVIPEDIKDPEEGESLGFTFCGLLSFSDSLRDDVSEAIKTAKNAGIKVIMATGDYSETAKSVAEKAGLNSANIVLGRDFDTLADEAILLAVHNDSIFARMLPDQKLRLITILKEAGEVVAMTGDGVNDAPSLVSADIGIAQGNGTEVAKDASDIILTSGSFVTIIEAIKEGRRAFSNMRKIVSYLLTTSASDIILIGGSMVAGLQLPLLPAQILWANIIGGGFMSFPFAFEPADEGLMESKTRNSSNSLLEGGVGKMIIFISLFTGGLLIVLYAILNYMHLGLQELRTVMFVAISLDSIFLAFSFKSLKRPVWRTTLLSNSFLLIAMAVSTLLLFLAITWPPIMLLLSIEPISITSALLLLLLGVANVIVVEVAKVVFVRKRL